MKGFTLIEILVVISILLLITTMGIDVYSGSRKYMVVDLESDKLVSLLQSYRQEAKAFGKCIGVKIEISKPPVKAVSDYDGVNQDCDEDLQFTPIAWSGEADISQVSPPANELTVLFSPPFGEIQMQPVGSDERQVTISFKNKPEVFKAISINSATGKIQKL